MSDQTTAKILAKGTNATGITETLAEKLHDRLGKTIVVIAEITSDSRTENTDGDQKVNLKIKTIEPAPTPETEDHLRELARSFHYERRLADGQLEISTGDDLEPKVADVLAAGNRHLPHDYIPDESTTTEECNVCGHAPDHHLHRDPPVDEMPDPDEDADQDEDPDAESDAHDGDGEPIGDPWPGDPDYDSESDRTP